MFASQARSFPSHQNPELSSLWILCSKCISIIPLSEVVQELAREEMEGWSKASDLAHHVEGVGVGVKPRAPFKLYTYHTHTVPEISKNFDEGDGCCLFPALKSTERSIPEINESLRAPAYMSRLGK